MQPELLAWIESHAETAARLTPDEQHTLAAALPAMEALASGQWPEPAAAAVAPDRVGQYR